MNYYKAKPIADRIVELLKPHCEANRIHIAGSIRREKVEVKDIEIVCQPKRTFHQTDLFGGGEWKIVKGYHDALYRITESVIKGEPEGKMMQISLRGTDMILDLFTPRPDDYFRQYAIRTGSADYSTNVIAAAWVAKGWCGTTNAGLRLQRHCIKKDSGWFCLNLQSETPPTWQSEQEFFDWLGVPYVSPRERNI